MRWAQGKMLISKLIGWGARGIRWAGMLLGCLSRSWISGGAHEVWTMTRTPLQLNSLSLSFLSLAYDVGLLGDSAASVYHQSIMYVHRLLTCLRRLLPYGHTMPISTS